MDESLSSAAGREEPGIDSVEIFGPYKVRGAGEPRAVSVCSCASRVLPQRSYLRHEDSGPVARRAFRRPVTDRDLAPLLNFYWDGLVRTATSSRHSGGAPRILVDPEFLFRIEQAPAGAARDQSIA